MYFQAAATLALALFSRSGNAGHAFDSYSISSKTATGHWEKYANATPLDTFYIRNGKLIGHQLGYLNETIAAMNAASSTDLATRETDDEDAVNWNFSLLDVAGSLTLVGGVICFFVPACLSTVAANLAAAGVTAISAGPGGVGVNIAEGTSSDRKMMKRQSTQYEGVACEYNAEDTYCTDGSNYVDAAYQAMVMNDVKSSSATSGIAASAWSMTAVNGGNQLAMYWHCISEGSQCSFNDNGPTNIVTDNS